MAKLQQHPVVGWGGQMVRWKPRLFRW
jgi:hypothetical protein